MNRKKEIITVAIIECLINLLIIVLLVIGQLSVTEFLITFGVTTLLTLLASVFNIYKFPTME